MTLLTMTPSRSGYRVGVSSGYDTTDVMAGSPRYRSVMTGAPHQITVQWNTGPAGYTYLLDFYKTNQSIPFEINLPIDTPRLTQYTAHFIPGTFQLSSVSGNSYSVQAELEITLSDQAELRRALDILQPLYPTDLNDIIRLTRESVVEGSTIC